MIVERVSRGLSQPTQREVLARAFLDLANPVLVVIPLVLGVIWQDAASWLESLLWGGLHPPLTTSVPTAVLVALLALHGIARARGGRRCRNHFS